MKEILVIAQEVQRNAQHESTKKLLSPFSRECPACGKGPEQWKIDVPTYDDVVSGRKKPAIRVFSDGLHLVRYRCECGECFKKAECGEDLGL